MENRSRLVDALKSHRIPELEQRGFQVVLSDIDQPVLITGTDSYVARVVDAVGTHRALRVAKEYGSGLFWQRHYQSIHDELPRSARPYFPQTIQPIHGGITLVGRRIPAVLLEWITGPTLFAAIHRAAIDHNITVLDAIAFGLHDLSIGLRDSRVTHGNLTPDNILLRSNGDLICVDLDTLSWPGARRRVPDPSDHAYGHPRQDGTSQHQDSYAILVLLVSVLLLTEVPDLRLQYGDAVEVPDGSLIFQQADLTNPTASRLFASIAERVGPRGNAALELLGKASVVEAFLAQQYLEEAFDLLSYPEFPSGAMEASMVPVVSGEQVDLDIPVIVTKLRELYGYAPTRPVRRTRDYETTWPDDRPIPPAAPLVETMVWDDAPARSSDTEVVRRPLERIARRVGVDRNRLLEDEAAEARAIDLQMAEHAQSNDDLAVIDLADLATKRGLILDEQSRRIARSARERVALQHRLETALSSNDRRELADLATSGDLERLGDDRRAKLIQVLDILGWPELLRPLETDDDHLILLWSKDISAVDERALPHVMRARISLAREREQWLAEVRTALREGNAEALELLVRREPAGARQKLGESERSQVREAVEKRRVLHELQRAISAGSMQRMIGALEAVHAAGAALNDPELRASVRSVEERVSLVEQVIHVARQDPPNDRLLAALLPRLMENGYQHDAALRGDVAIDRLEMMVARGAAVRRIRRAIARNDPRAIRLASFPDTTGALLLLTPTERSLVDAARSHRRVKRSHGR